jgi:hypothetical protein
MTKTIIFMNVGTGLASTTAFASGTDVIIKVSNQSGTTAIPRPETGASSTARLTFIHQGSSSVQALFERFMPF